MVVDYEVDFCDVESSGGEISGDQNESLSSSESGQVVYSLRVFHEGVKLSGW